MKQIILCMAFLVSSISFAKLTTFEKEIEFVYKDNKLFEVRDNSISEKIKVSDYLLKIVDIIKLERDNYNKDKSAYENELFYIIGQDKSLSSDLKNAIKKAFKRLLTLDPTAILTNPELKKFLKELDERIAISMKAFNPKALARPNSPKYFYQMNTTKDLILWAINRAESTLSSVPYLGIIISLIEYVDENFQSKRFFNQNKLLYYLENYTPQELGITELEIAKIKTSIYESRLNWRDFSQLRSMTSHWNAYGTTKYNKSYESYSNRLISFSTQFDSQAKRVGFMMADVYQDGSRKIVNLKDKNNRFDSSLSNAFYFDSPMRITRTRLLIKLSKAGLEMVKLPGFIKKEVTKYLDSMYKEQAISEGELVGFFQDMGEEKYEEIIKSNF